MMPVAQPKGSNNYSPLYKDRHESGRNFFTIGVENICQHANSLRLRADGDESIAAILSLYQDGRETKCYFFADPDGEYKSCASVMSVMTGIAIVTANRRSDRPKLDQPLARARLE
jgi:hypothetical protein